MSPTSTTSYTAPSTLPLGFGAMDYLNNTLTVTKRASNKAFTVPNPSLMQPFPIVILEPLNDTFATKRLELFEPIKIGRKVGPKSSPEPSNGIFDSKVLSRTHAELWHENGKVFIKDVKSSNGTFVNGVRLSEEGMPSSPKELKSGDMIEFGIDILNEDGVTALYQKVSCKVTVVDSHGRVLTNGVSPSLDLIEAVATAQAAGHGLPVDHVLGMLDAELRKSADTNAELEHLRATLADVQMLVQKSNSSLLANNASTAAEQQQLQQEQQQYQKQIEELRSEVKLWTDKYNAVAPVVKEQDEVLKSVEKVSAENEKLKKEIAAFLEKEKENLQSGGSQAALTEIGIEALKAKLAKAESEMMSLKEVGVFTVELVHPLHVFHEKLTVANHFQQHKQDQAHQNAIQDLEKQLSNIENLRQESLQRLQALETELKQQNDQLAERDSEVNTLRTRLEATQKALDNARKEGEEKAKEVERLNARVAVVEGDLDEVRKMKVALEAAKQRAEAIAKQAEEAKEEMEKKRKEEQEEVLKKLEAAEAKLAEKRDEDVGAGDGDKTLRRRRPYGSDDAEAEAEEGEEDEEHEGVDGEEKLKGKGGNLSSVRQPFFFQTPVALGLYIVVTAVAYFLYFSLVDTTALSTSASAASENAL
ncbi:hypothetical protein HK102_011762 [Quaeritorhiza haematococci]|nr:hypothetical protein HK102_011762 [Quaeritorhiza haematococci]